MTRELNQPNQIFASFDEDPGFQWTVDHIQVLNDLMSCVREGDMNGMNQLISLNTLKLDVMKIDMSLIRQASATGDYSILRFATLLADGMRLKTVVEGVETAEQVAALKVLGCDYIQGYYFSKPLPVDEFEAYLKAHCGEAEA